MTNHGVHNLSQVVLTADQRKALGAGLRFIPLCPRPPSPEELSSWLQPLDRQLRLFYFFKGQDRQPDSRRSPWSLSNSSWNPPADKNPVPRSAKLALERARQKLEWHRDKRIAHLRFRSNTSRVFWESIQSLIRDRSITIKPSDKNLGLTVVDREWYNNEAYRQLNDRLTYQPLGPNFEFGSVFGQLNDLVDELKFSRMLDSTEVDFILRSKKDERTGNDLPFKVPNFYMLIKVHKKPVVGRPIVASTNWVTTQASKYVAIQLQGLMKHVSDLVPDSMFLVKELERTRWPLDTECTLVAADVVNLYPSIPIKDALRQLKAFFALLGEENVGLGFNADTVLRLTEFVLENNFLSFGDQIYHQIKGTAMGTNLAPALANIWVFMTLRPATANLPGRYFRFLDDLLLLLQLDPAHAERWLAGLQNLHEALKFTWSISTHEVPFLDVLVQVKPGFRQTGVFQTSVYQKSLNAYLYIPAHSGHTLKEKRGWVRGELIRYVRLSSTQAGFFETAALFFERLRARGYSADTLRPWFREVSYSERPRFLERERMDDRTRPPLFVAAQLGPHTQALPWRAALTLTVPSASDPNQSSALTTRVAFRHPRSLQSILKG